MPKQQVYTREALMAFANFTSCRTRPDGLDPILWSDGASYNKAPQDEIPEWRRAGGGGALLHARRKPYDEETVANALSSTYPPRPAWGDTSSSMCVPHDCLGPGSIAPSSRRERLGHRDSERGRGSHDWEGCEGTAPVGEQVQRMGVERDGLLGSGTWPPPTAPRLGRTSETYQSLRPTLKGSTYGRHEDTDTVNDETFGSSEASNDERAEQERKRRESFEMMRREQHRKLQEHMLPQTKVDNPAVPRKHDENCLWDDHPRYSPPLSPTGRNTARLVATTPRLAVPPGFSKVAQKRQTPSQGPPLQDDDAEAGHSASKKIVVEQEATPNNGMETESKIDETLLCAGGADLITTIKPTSMELEAAMTESMAAAPAMSRPRGTIETLLEETSDVWSFSIEGSCDTVPIDRSPVEELVKRQPESLLDKLFGKPTSGFATNGPMSSDFLLDKGEVAADDLVATWQSPMGAAEGDTWSEIDCKRSKFAQWFHSEEEKISSEQMSSTNILSLFEKSEKLSALPSLLSVKEVVQGNGNLGRNILPMPVGLSLEDIEKGLTVCAQGDDTTAGNCKESVSKGVNAAQGGLPALPPVFMTCEDIEQTLLAEAAGCDLALDAPLVSAAESPLICAISASQHLLALLQRGPSMAETCPSSSGAGFHVTGKECGSEWAWGRPEPEPGSEVHSLEALFGKAFMRELRSLEAPLQSNTYSDKVHGSGKTEGVKPLYPPHSGSKHLPKVSVIETATSQPWFGRGGPALAFGWPDIKDVEASPHKYFRDLTAPHHPVMSDQDGKLHPKSSSSGHGLGIDENKLHRLHEYVNLDTHQRPAASFGGHAVGFVLGERQSESNQGINGEVAEHKSAELESKYEDLASLGASGKSRPLALNDKAALLTGASEADSNGGNLVDSAKRQFSVKDFSESVGKSKERSVNGAIGLLALGNGHELNSSIGPPLLSASQPVLQQQYGVMYGSQSPPVLPLQRSRPPPPPFSLQQHQQVSQGPPSSAFPRPSFRPQIQPPLFSNGNLEFPFDTPAARAFAAAGHVHFQPPPHAFRAAMSHPFVSPSQMLQGPHLFPTMIVEEDFSVKHPSPVASLHGLPGHHVHGQLRPVQDASTGYLPPFSTDFSRAASDGYEVDGNGWGGALERWF